MKRLFWLFPLLMLASPAANATVVDWFNCHIWAEKNQEYRDRLHRAHKGSELTTMEVFQVKMALRRKWFSNDELGPKALDSRSGVLFELSNPNQNGSKYEDTSLHLAVRFAKLVTSKGDTIALQKICLTGKYNKFGLELSTYPTEADQCWSEKPFGPTSSGWTVVPMDQDGEPIFDASKLKESQIVRYHGDDELLMGCNFEETTK